MTRLYSFFLFVFISLFFISPSFQQCTDNQNYVHATAEGTLKQNAINTIKLACIGTMYGESASFAGSVMRFAAERLNNRLDILPDTKIELYFIPNATNTVLSNTLLYTLFAIQNLGVNGIIGGISTAECRTIQLAAKLYNITQISSHGTGSVLANKDEYPFYAVTQVFDDVQISTIVTQFTFFHWTRGVILYSENDYGAGYTNLVLQGAQAGIEFAAFSIGTSTKAADIRDQVEAAKNHILTNHYRIIVLYLTADATALVMNLANEMGIVGDEYVYILGTNAAGVYTQPYPNYKAVLPYLKGSIGVRLPLPAGPFYTQEFQAYMQAQAQRPATYTAYNPGFQFFFALYDPLLAFAHGFDSLLDQNMPFSDIKGQLLYDTILNNTFDGPTGEVVFTSKGDRLGYYALINLQNASKSPVEVGQYSAKSNNISASSLGYIFYNGSNIVPSDGASLSPPGYTCRLVSGQVICERDYTPHKYSQGLAGGLGAIVSVGVLVAIFAIIMLVFNWKTFVGKYGTFYCAVIIAGVLCGYVAAFSLLPEPTDNLCVIFPWFLGVAFTLVYGCLFIKAWILYRLWRYALQLKRMAVTALTVVKYVGVALCVEIILLIIWTVVDPPKVHIVKMVDHTTAPLCRSDTPTFWIIFLSLKGVWLTFGVVVSVLTRTVVKEYHNFTEFAYAMYNILIMAIIAVPLGILLQEVPNGVTIVSVIVIVLAFMFSTIILFFNIWHSILYTEQMPSAFSANKSSPAQSNLTDASSSYSRN